MNHFRLLLGVIALISGVNQTTEACYAYYAEALTLRAARAVVKIPVMVRDLKPLSLKTIAHVDDAWRISHWLASASDIYQYDIDFKQGRFLRSLRKASLIGRLTIHAYDLLEKTTPSIPLVDLRNHLFDDHSFCESAWDLDSAGFEKAEFPACEAGRLVGLFIDLPKDPRRRLIVPSLEQTPDGRPITRYRVI